MMKYPAILVACLLTASCATDTAVKAPLNQKQQVFLTPKQHVKSGVSELIASITEIQNLDFSKGKYEKESEFLGRMSSYYQKYDGRRFFVPIKCDFEMDDGRKLVSYNVEKEAVVLKFPNMNIERVTLKQGDDISFSYFNYSFIPAGEPDFKTGTYAASNAFGRKVDVSKIERNRVGIAVFTAGVRPFRITADPKPLEIAFHLPRDLARTSLDKCAVILDVQAQYNDIWAFQRQDFDFKNENTTMLFARSRKIDPTVSRPVEIKTKDIALPVDLLGLSIVSENGRQLLEKKFY